MSVTWPNYCAHLERNIYRYILGTVEHKTKHIIASHFALSGIFIQFAFDFCVPERAK